MGKEYMSRRGNCGRGGHPREDQEVGGKGQQSCKGSRRNKEGRSENAEGQRVERGGQFNAKGRKSVYAKR